MKFKDTVKANLKNGTSDSRCSAFILSVNISCILLTIMQTVTTNLALSENSCSLYGGIHMWPLRFGNYCPPFFEQKGILQFFYFINPYSLNDIILYFMFEDLGLLFQKKVLRLATRLVLPIQFRYLTKRIIWLLPSCMRNQSHDVVSYFLESPKARNLFEDIYVFKVRYQRLWSKNPVFVNPIGSLLFCFQHVELTCVPHHRHGIWSPLSRQNLGRGGQWTN